MLNHPSPFHYAVAGPSTLHFSLRYATPRQDVEASEMHPDTVVPPYGAGEIHEMNKITSDRILLPLCYRVFVPSKMTKSDKNEY